MLLTAGILSFVRMAEAETPVIAAPPVISAGQTAGLPGNHSVGVAEIIKLLDAKMEAPVIVSYIQNSPIPYQPDARELIALKDHGASPELLIALLHRGDELRRQMAQAQRAVIRQTTIPDYGTATVEATYPVYPDNYSDSTYYYPDYPATYYGPGYGYAWPTAFSPPVPIRPYRPYLHSPGRFAPLRAVRLL